jgi:hypothetical protein
MRDQRTPIVVPLPPLPRAPGRLVHGDCPPEGAVTLAMAAELEGLRARSINSVRAHLDPVRLSDRWVGPGDRKPRALYSRSEVERIAGELKRRRPNPYKPPMYSPCGRQHGYEPSTENRDVPAGWVTAKELQDALYDLDHDVTARTVRAILVDGRWPRGLGRRVAAALRALFDELGLPPPTRARSERRLVGQRIQRVYPKEEVMKKLLLGIEGVGERSAFDDHDWRTALEVIFDAVRDERLRGREMGGRG